MEKKLNVGGTANKWYGIRDGSAGKRSLEEKFFTLKTEEELEKDNHQRCQTGTSGFILDEIAKENQDAKMAL